MLTKIGQKSLFHKYQEREKKKPNQLLRRERKKGHYRNCLSWYLIEPTFTLIIVAKKKQKPKKKKKKKKKNYF